MSGNIICPHYVSAPQSWHSLANISNRLQAGLFGRPEHMNFFEKSSDTTTGLKLLTFRLSLSL